MTSGQTAVPNGFWKVFFRASNGDSGSGVATVLNGEMYGGDNSFMYRGHIEADNEENVKGRIRVTQYGLDGASIFGHVPNGKEFTLEVIGRLGGNIIRGQMHMLNNPQMRADFAFHLAEKIKG